MSGLRTALFGCGQIGARYAADPLMSKFYPYSSHAQVLADHPAFDWVAAVDPVVADAQACADAYQVVAAADVSDLADTEDIELAVLATPPGARRKIVEALPGLKAVVVEKPLGANMAEADDFAALCRRRNLVVQVSLPRRADTSHRALANGELQRLAGDIQAAFLIYGNGLRNNGTHMIDVARMLLGEIRAVSVPAGASGFAGSPLADDINTPFTLAMECGVMVMGQPISFEHYRENALDLWGTEGRVSLISEGLRICRFAKRANRSTTGAYEIVSDEPTAETTSMGHALYALYDDLAEALAQGCAPVSTIDSALATTAVVEDVIGQVDVPEAA